MHIVIQKLKLVFPGITELQDYTLFGRLQSKIMNIRLLDYIYRNIEIVTCIPSDYGITYIVIQKLKLVFPGITELQDYTHFGHLQSQIMNRRLRDYKHRDTEIVTCVLLDYGITYIEQKITRLRTSYYRNRNWFSLGLRDYVYCNP